VIERFLAGGRLEFSHDRMSYAVEVPALSLKSLGELVRSRIMVKLGADAEHDRRKSLEPTPIIAPPARATFDIAKLF
jgi:hypothetical protein